MNKSFETRQFINPNGHKHFHISFSNVKLTSDTVLNFTYLFNYIIQETINFIKLCMSLGLCMTLWNDCLLLNKKVINNLLNKMVNVDIRP